MSLLATMCSLMKIQCCKQSQGQRTMHEVELKTIQQILRERSFEFSDNSNKPVGSDEDSSVSDENWQEATQEQHV